MTRTKTSIGLGILVTLTISLLSCGTLFTKGGGDYRSGESAYGSGDFPAAAEYAISALKANSTFEEAIDLMNRSFPKATETLVAQIQQIEASSQEFKNEAIIPIYERLNRMHSDAGNLSMGLPVNNYSEALQAARDGALEDRYQAGITALNEGGFRNARLAARHLDIVRQQVSDYKDINYYLNQAWEGSTAKLYIYVASDLGNLASSLGARLMDNRQFADVTELVPAGSMGLARNMPAEQVAGRLRPQGVDLILYVSGEISSSVTPLAENNKALSNGFPGTEITASYSASLAGNWQILDVATQETLAHENYSTGSGEQLSFIVLNPSERRELIPDGGNVNKRTVPTLRVESFGGPLGTPMRRVISTARFNDTTNASNPDRFTTMSLNDITSTLDGVWLHNDVYAIADGEGGQIYADNNNPTTWARLDAVVNKHKAIYQNIRQNVDSNMNTYVTRAENGLIPEASDVLRRAATGPLMQ